MFKFPRIFLALMAISFLLSVAGGVRKPIESRFVRLLPLADEFLTGLTFSIGAISYVIFAPLMGKLSIRYGKSGLISIGCLMSIVVPFLLASAFSVYWYMGIRAVEGLSAAMVGPIFMAFLQDALKDSPRKGKMFGIYWTASSIAGAISAMLGGLISDLFGLKYPFFAAGILATAPALAFLKIFGSKQEVSRVGNKKSAAGGMGIKDGLKFIFSTRILVINFILFTSMLFGFSMRGVIYPPLCHQLTGSDTITGSIFASMGVAAMILLPLTGHFVDKFGVKWAAIIGWSILASAGIGLAFYTGIAYIWVLSVAIACGEAFAGPILGTIQTENIPDKIRGQILTLFSSLYGVLGFIGPALAGALWKATSFSFVLLVFGLFYLSSLILSSLLFKTMRK